MQKRAQPIRRLPSNLQLVLPLLESLKDGPKAASDVEDDLAQAFDLPQELTQAFASGAASGRWRLWPRRVRWAKETAKHAGLVRSEKRGIWALTEEGRDGLYNVRPGIVIVVYESDAGQVLWADAMSTAEILAENTVQLALASPPYPLLVPRAYGNLLANDYIDWLTEIIGAASKVIKEDGSLVLNLGVAATASGMPTESLYREKLLIRLTEDLGIHHIQRFEWINPSKPPAGHFVTVRRQRVKTMTESLFWLSKTPFPKVRQQSVLTPYGDSMRRTIAKGGERRSARPSGHGTAKNGFSRDNGGAIPGNIIIAPGVASNSPYQRFCRSMGLPAHPAMFPRAVPEFFIKLLTDPGDTVWDFFCGSGTTREVADDLGRQFIVNDRSLTYLAGSFGR